MSLRNRLFTLNSSTQSNHATFDGFSKWLSARELAAWHSHPLMSMAAMHVILNFFDLEILVEELPIKVEPVSIVGYPFISFSPVPGSYLTGESGVTLSSYLFLDCPGCLTSRYVFPPSRPSGSGIPTDQRRTPVWPSCPQFLVRILWFTPCLLGRCEPTITNTRKPACWASAGYNTAGCAAVESALRGCMDAPKMPPKPKSAINYHLARFQKRLEGPTKRK